MRRLLAPLVAVAASALLVSGCTGPTNDPVPSDPAPTAPAGPVRPTPEQAQQILADYDVRNNAAIAKRADWKTADGGVTLARDYYSDKLAARDAKNKGKKVTPGKPLTSTLINVLGWSAEGSNQTLMVSETFAGTPRVTVFVKLGEAPWRQWAAVIFPAEDNLPQPAPDAAVKAPTKTTTNAINNYRANGSLPSGVTLAKDFVKYFSVLKRGLPGFSSSRTCATSVDEKVAGAWQVTVASGTLTLVANRCTEKATASGNGWITYNWDDDKIFGTANKKLSSYSCQLNGNIAQVAGDTKSTWYGPTWHRLSQCQMKVK